MVGHDSLLNTGGDSQPQNGKELYIRLSLLGQNENSKISFNEMGKSFSFFVFRTLFTPVTQSQTAKCQSLCSVVNVDTSFGRKV